MRRSKDRTTVKTPKQIADLLQELIESTKAANLQSATQLLQLARLDVLMNEHGIAAEEIDQLRIALERRSSSGDVVDLQRLRRARQQRATLVR